MKKLLFSVLTLLLLGLGTPSISMAGEGWCGGTDTKACCSKLGEKKCSCACVPGNCYCGGMKLSAGGSSTTTPLRLPLKVIILDSGRTTSERQAILSVPAR